MFALFGITFINYTIEAVGCPNPTEGDGAPDACYEVTIRKMKLATGWFYGGNFADLLPSTAFRVIVGAKLPECPGTDDPEAFYPWNHTNAPLAAPPLPPPLAAPPPALPAPPPP